RNLRKSMSISALFPLIRQGILAATCLHPDRWWYQSDLARHLAVRPSSLQRELASLVAAGVLERRRDGNRVYFRADSDCPILPDLQGLLLKTVGLVDVLRESLEPLSASIEWAFVYGSIARGEEVGSSDVDLMVIGDVGLAALAPPLARAEQRLLCQVNPTVYARAEFLQKLAAGNHFLREVLAREKLFVLGRVSHLETALELTPR
ncbi:MAG: nucleotidyltransferase domain-containing protein, partial [Pseudomonadota bacterium]